MEFSSKYRNILAPHGILASPKEVLSASAENTIRKAFKITRKKLKNLRKGCANCSNENDGHFIECSKCRSVQYCSENCNNIRLVSHSKVCDRLRNEKLDQILECLPSPVPLGKDILKGKGGPIKDWSEWFQKHTCLGERIKSSVAIVQLWWEYVGLRHEDDNAVQYSLERIISNVFSTVLTIGHAPYWVFSDDSSTVPCTQSFCSKTVNFGIRNELNIHLIGADKPEVSAISSGLIQVASKILKMPLAITLVAPDLARHPETFTWSILKPEQITPSVKASAFTGLYHDFWNEYISTKDNTVKGKIAKPDLCLAIHPGVHTSEMFALWRPTLELLAKEEIPVVMTTYNEAEFEQTMKVISSLNPIIKLSGENPHGSLQWKQTPYEPDHVWASNSYLIVIQNKLRNCFL